MFLTKAQTPIIGWVAILLGFIMNGIFIAQSSIGLDNIGLCIILFTIVIYMLMTPLTYQQQKFSRLSSKMQPELQAVQKKYKGKNDQNSMAKMNEETQAIYAKYGVNPMGSCAQLAIQMPVLFALYRVI
ncbi:MAG: membrane protein insertase YidC, partial [Eubacteriales bacterium]|nr:membrane protein insertase YidC [Eubacteriales bacterium]